MKRETVKHFKWQLRATFTPEAKRFAADALATDAKNKRLRKKLRDIRQTLRAAQTAMRNGVHSSVGVLLSIADVAINAALKEKT